ncbi:hypothetical protein HRI_004310700 [Hibiscus trionum]|uniref:RING-type E3 ubiquitin transferase n=1 Tax=Hibiscus trionum TaxID=183268 RepID=A0A9W7MP11_HIBTR|nr:hypothetical protein HRI_004310700 [Hibiscus trionum]
MACHYRIRGMQEHEDPFAQLGSDFPHDLFNIDVEIRWVSSLHNGATIETFERSVVGRRDLFLFEENGRNIIHSLVAGSNAPPELIDAVIVPSILSFARDVNSLPMNLGRQVIRLRIELLVEVSHDDVIGELIDESMTSSVNFKPASKLSIKALKRVKWDDEDEGHLPLKKRRKLVEGSSSRKGCTVCLDDFLDGDDVASMPCGHVYHYGCIVKWLETSHMCPLCRFHMPID